MRTSTHYCVNTAQEYSEEPSTIVAAVSGGMPARNKLLMACFKMVQKNSCRTPACEYSHDPGIVAEAHETQIADLLKAKRDLQVTHTNTMKVFEKDGARSYKQVNPSIQRKPNDPNGVPTISLITYSPPGPQLDQHIGGSMNAIDASPSLADKSQPTYLAMGAKLKSLSYAQPLILPLGPCSTQDVLLATNNSAKQNTQHIIIDARHVDSRGTTRILKLRIWSSRRSTIRHCYRPLCHRQDLLTPQLEHQEARTHNLAMLYGQQPCLLMITSEEDDDTIESTGSTTTVAMLPLWVRPD